jgi:lactoylglutathione lyase
LNEILPKGTIMITKIEKVTIYVESQEEAISFWTEKMGFVLTFEQPMGPNARWIEVSPTGDTNLTSLVLYSKPMMLQQSPETVSHPSIIFATTDIEALWETLSANEVEISEIQQLPFGKMFDFKDNDGNPYMVRE